MKLKNSFLLVLVALAFLCIPQSVSAVTKVSESVDDPEYGRAHGQISKDFYSDSDSNPLNDKISAVFGSRNTTSSYTGGGYVHNTKFDNYAITNVIDVSKYQGTINWSAVKAAGIDYAFVRVASRGASTGALTTDPTYSTNLRNAAAAGIKVGAYIYSQAVSPDEAREEANYVLNLVSGYNITMPLIIDYEYASNGGRLYTANLSNDTATATVNAFCSTITSAGYTPMVYANKNMLATHMNASSIPYLIWLAHYTSQTTYTGDYTCWQYSSNGSVSGISGNVDMNFWYGDTSGILHAYNGYYNGVNYNTVFDPTYYAAQNPDVAAAYGNDSSKLLEHFINYGMNEGRLASNSFNVNIYKDNYSDLSAAFGSNLKSYYMHYINNGQAEGRTATTLLNKSMYNGVDYSLVYNYNYYIAQNPDISAAFSGDAYKTIQHFVTFGMSEGRKSISSFNVKAYRANNKDIRLTCGNDLKKYYLHYMNYGHKENRTFTGNETITDGVTICDGIDYSPVYNYSYYISKNPDIAAAFPNDDISVLKHFVQFGMNEGRASSSTFDVKAYRAQYKDLRVLFGNDYKSYFMHYVKYGHNENRITTGSETIADGVTVYNGQDYSAVYNYSYYIAANPDVAAQYPNDDIAVLQHFVTFGMNEARQASADFNVNIYKTKNPDVAASCGDNAQAYYMHYIKFGKAEGRVAK